MIDYGEDWKSGKDKALFSNSGFFIVKTRLSSSRKVL